MEDDVIELEGQVEVLLNAAHLAPDVFVHLPLVRVWLAPVVHQAVVQVRIHLLSKLVEDFLFGAGARVNDLFFSHAGFLLLLNLERLLGDEGQRSLVEDVVVGLVDLVSEARVGRRQLYLAVIILEVEFLVEVADVIFAGRIDRPLVGLVQVNNSLLHY